MICGIDEAGRGSMIGPLVIAGLVIEKSKTKILTDIGVRDSKKLSPHARQKLYGKIIKLADDYAISKITPHQIDAHVLNHRLNHLEASHMARVIKKLKPTISYVDSCDVNEKRFGREVDRMAKTGKIKSYHHADSTFVVVSAASIIAKVTRDMAIAKLNKEHDLGSGYPSDAKTVRFVQNWFFEHGQMPDFVRKSWAPVRSIAKSYALA